MTVKTWTYAYNTAPTDQTTLTQQCRSFIYQLVTFLTANGWTAIESSDGSAVTSAGWSGLSALNWAASGAHSWIILKSPAGIVAGADGSYTGDQSRIWFTIDLLSANTYQAAFRWHRVAPTGGGTTSAIRTSADQIGFATQTFLRSTLSATGMWHFLITTEGSFLAFAGYTGLSYLPFCLVLLPTTGVSYSTALGRDYPWATAAFAGWLDATPGAFGNASSSIFFTINVVVCWTSDGGAGTAALYPLGMIGAASTAGFGYNMPSTGDYFTGDQKSSDVRLQCTTLAKGADIGWVADIQGSGASTAQNSVDSVTTPTKVFWGKAWLPCDVVPSI